MRGWQRNASIQSASSIVLHTWSAGRRIATGCARARCAACGWRNERRRHRQRARLHRGELRRSRPVQRRRDVRRGRMRTRERAEALADFDLRMERAEPVASDLDDAIEERQPARKHDQVRQARARTWQDRPNAHQRSKGIWLLARHDWGFVVCLLTFACSRLHRRGDWRMRLADGFGQS